MPSLSIIIVTYNPGPILDDCLRSLPDGIGALDAEIIVVDNQSQDGTPSRIRDVYPHVRLIANTDNRGFAAANNQGLAAATGDYLLLLNPDVIVRPNALSRMMDYLREHPAVGVVGPRTYDRQGDIALTAHRPLTWNIILWQYLGLARLFPYRVYGHYRRACEQASDPFAAGWVQAHCLMMSRRVYDYIGGMDDGFFLFAEDPDLCERASSAGFGIMYLPDALIEHHESTSVSRYPLVKMRHYHISPLYYFRKRRHPAAVRWLKAGFTVELLLKLILRLLQLNWFADSPARKRLRAYGVVLLEVWRY